ncbi:MAG: acetate--CoA ligase, partial [Gemmatimonadota bacterium]|nr:acetate--CoA ligase [Gemmatimonadota bacterium]
MNNIDTLLSETRSFPPPDSFRTHARVRDGGLHASALADPEAFWATEAAELEWMRPWDTVMEWTPPHVKWFSGGQLNASVNCLDRHIRGPRRNKAALIWEGEPGDVRTYTFWDLYREVNIAGNMLKGLGVTKGDRVAIYMPMIPEAVIAMLACARIGAPHSVVFGGFSSDSLRDRINDAECKVLITADGSFRRGQTVPLKKNADNAIRECPTIEKVLVVKRGRCALGDLQNAVATGEPAVSMQSGRDHWWHEYKQTVGNICEPEPMDAEDVLFILYTSGTTGQPKGIVHTTGGYLTGVAATTKYTFDLRDDDVFWCTADIGWVTGHSYLTYGPLANGATCLMYEGAPDWPEKNRFWQMCERYGVTIFYTAPTAIRAFMKWGADIIKPFDLSRLRLLGSVGEPINPEAWMWYREHVGANRCPIIDTWWQTETGAIMITPLPGVTATKPGSGTLPFPGTRITVLDSDGKEIGVGGGLLAITRPWPAIARTIWKDDARYVHTFFSKWPGRPDLYFAGDGVKRDEDGYLFIILRVDDV